MNHLFHELVKRKEYLEVLMETIRKREQNSPIGKLRISNDKGILHYYCITESGDTRGKYIPKNNYKLAQQLAQKDYMHRLYQEAARELKDINMYLANHGETDLEEIYTSLNQYRKNIVEPMAIPDDIFVWQWENEQYEVNPYYQEEKVYPTKKDECVRSKSEVLLADMYYELGIPYRYEAELRLKNGKKKYPDFTLLNIKTRKVIYHEHLGLMDNEEYRKMNYAKLDEYQKSGIYMGKNLIITYEGEGCYLNIKDIKRMVQNVMGI